LLEFLENALFLHIVTSRWGMCELLSDEGLDKIDQILPETDWGIKTLFVATRVRFPCEILPLDIWIVLASSGKDRHKRLIVLGTLSKKLGLCHKRVNAPAFFEIHDALVKNVIEELACALSAENLADEEFEKIFRVAIALCLCQYWPGIRTTPFFKASETDVGKALRCGGEGPQLATRLMGF
jgi:hypothetical protein